MTKKINSISDVQITDKVVIKEKFCDDDRIVDIGVVVKKTKSQITVKCGDENIRYRFDKYGSMSPIRKSGGFGYPRHDRFSFSRIELLEENDEVKAIEDVIKKIKNDVKQAKELENKRQEEARIAKEAKHIKEVNEFWDSEGWEIYAHRKEMTMGGVNVIVLERVFGNGRGKVAIVHVSMKNDSLYPDKSYIEVQRGGMEIRNGSGNETYISFWSGSSYRLYGQDWHKELVYNELANLY